MTNKLPVYNRSKILNIKYNKLLILLYLMFNSTKKLTVCYTNFEQC